MTDASNLKSHSKLLFDDMAAIFTNDSCPTEIFLVERSCDARTDPMCGCVSMSGHT